MSGRLQEISFSELEERQQSSQSSLDQYSDSETTYVAVVSLPTSRIEDATDEVWPEVGMPEKALKTFLARRSGYRGNSAIDDPHNQAYEDVGLREIYLEHLEKSRAAQDRIRDTVERVVAGENITLVCYEGDGEKCHRHILIDKISEKVESREACKFELRA
jgi:hypothetical protein